MRFSDRRMAVGSMLVTMFLAAASAQACPHSSSPDSSCTCSAGCTCCHGGDTNPKVQPPPPEDGVVDILIAGYTFTPFEVEVTQGTTVRWTNLDMDLHDTVSQDGLWDSGYLPEGESFSYTFTDDNFAQFSYICTLHGGMFGLIDVVPAPEPGSAALATVLTLGVCSSRKRRRS